ncbi:MAG TPA: protein kinase [Phycisphaerae bacterium]
MLSERIHPDRLGLYRPEVQAVLADVRRQRAAGIQLDDALILQQHPDIPGLDWELRRLRDMHEVFAATDSDASSTGQLGARRASLHDLEYLNEQLDQYVFLKQIQYGGQGSVYRARERATGREVAIKILLQGPLASPRQKQRLAREFDLISRLHHPNIVRPYDIGILRGWHYFAMEYIEGVPIDDFVARHVPSVSAVVALFIEICRTVSSAHQHGIIHRDLKPANVLIDAERRPHVLDFGLAKELTGAARPDSALTLANEVLGTPAYLSPEHVGANGGQVDVCSDVYGLGLVLYHLLTGGFPYPVTDDEAAYQRHILFTEPRPPNSVVAPDGGDCYPLPGTINRDLETVLLKALAKEKSRRYQSAAAFADDLERCLTGAPIEPRASNAFYLLRKTFRRNPLAAVIGAASLVLLIVSSAAVSVSLTRAGAARRHSQEIARVAHAILDDTVNEADEVVGNLAGGMAIREWMLQRIEKRLDDLAQLIGDEVALADVRAVMEEKRGDLALARGRHADAAGHFGRFLELCRHQPPAESSNPEWQLCMARAYRKLASVARQPLAHFTSAVQLGRQLAGGGHPPASARLEFGKTLLAFGHYLFNTGHYVEASARTDEALAIASSSVEANANQDAWVKLLGNALELQGDTRRKLGDGHGGIASYRESLRLRERLTEIAPADVDLRYRVLCSHVKLGEIYEGAGLDDEAQEALQRAVEVGNYLAQMDPSVAAWKQALHAAHDRLAMLAIRNDDDRQAQLHLDAALQLANDLRATEPEGIEWRATQAMTDIRAGYRLDKLGDFAAACSRFRDAAREYELILAATPGNMRAQSDLSDVYDAIARCARLLGEHEIALAYYCNAYDIRQTLAHAEPGVIVHDISLIVSESKLATWCLDRKTCDSDEIARQWLNRAHESLYALWRSGKLAWRDQRCADWFEAIDENQWLLRRRAQDRARASSPIEAPLNASQFAEP